MNSAFCPYFMFTFVLCSQSRYSDGPRVGRPGFTSRQEHERSLVPQRTDRLSGPPHPLSNGYRCIFLQDLSGRGVKFTVHLHLVPRLRMVGLYLHSPTCLCGKRYKVQLSLCLNKYYATKAYGGVDL
jgi:hypothetical protein